MDIFQGIVLGVVQGLTEFLPISSTAHLRVVPALLGWEDPGAAYSAVVQLGTLAAVLVYFFRDLLALTAAWFRGLFRGKPFSEPGAKMAWILILGTIPIGVLGLVFQHSIETTLRSLWVVALALIGLALLLALSEKGDMRREDDGCGILYGVLRDSAYKIRKMAEAEKESCRFGTRHGGGVVRGPGQATGNERNYVRGRFELAGRVRRIVSISGDSRPDNGR